ncbi:MAG TPA: hypothetical protein VIN08_22110 [Ohtaekwangia sp.]|uniref:hypothetical protein n=1 Tax=Ohtaekwangia sp. TaxID=2066019 RepID=UPI002F9327ED
MSHTEARYQLQQLTRKYKNLRMGEAFLLAVALACISFAIPYSFNIPAGICLAFAVMGGIIIFLYRCEQLRLFQLQEQNVAAYLNQQFTTLQNSSDLLLKDADDLSRLQQLQKIKTTAAFEALYPSIQLPHRLLQAGGICMLSIAIAFTLTSFAPLIQYIPSAKPAAQSTSSSENIPPPPAQVKQARIVITPPAYTKLPSQSTTGWSLTLPEGSTVTWNVQFTADVKEPSLLFSGKETVRMKADQPEGYTLRRAIQETGFYQLAWTTSAGEVKHSDFYKLEVTKDQAPVITINKLNQFTELAFSDKPVIDVYATLQDDYGLDNAHIIATVSKGSGESVKFREDKLFFEKPAAIAGKRLDATRRLDLIKLGMEPGDELYFYVVAFDNKQPLPNRTRTETYFISLQDTTQQETVIDDGLGVDLMPDYFRSQRQIIIDTEKLLKEKKQITKTNFQSKSNELGYDQKVLRLRYGEFLGEEFESGIGPQENPAEEDHDHEEEDIAKKYGHVHDKENEHNLVQEKKSEPEHHHHGESKDGEDKNGIPAGFVHEHDSEEEATFFTQSIRAKLKAALTIMWDAELHLRLYEPEKSLPFQYKALKLLKEISQDSRIYVHRTGFDPPPLKEEKRMTGDLSEVKSATANASPARNENYTAIREALKATALALAADSLTVSNTLKKRLTLAGQELGKLAIAEPGVYLKSLSLIRALTENELKPTEQRPALKTIQTSLWKALPDAPASPAAAAQALHTLDRTFIKKLEAHE